MRATSVIQIRPCRNEDFDAVLELLRQLWPGKAIDPIMLRTVYERALGTETQAYLCAAEDDHVVGFGSLTLKNNLWQEGYLAHLDELVVDTAHRGKGIGTKLLRQLIELAREKGCRRVELDSAHHREKAHEFYEQQGFENRGVIFSRTL